MPNFLKEPKIKVRTAIYVCPNSNACCWERLENWVKLYCMFKGTWVHAYWHIDLIIKPCFNKNLKIKDCKNILFIVRLIKFIWISFVFFLSLFSFSYQYLPFFYFIFPAESNFFLFFPLPILPDLNRCQRTFKFHAAKM